MRSEDEIFVNRCLEGDQPAFAFLVDKYKEVVHAYAYRKLGDYQEAEDITQEVFIKAYSKLAQLKWPHRFRSWLYTIVSNECKMWLRKHSDRTEREVSWEDVPAVELDKLAMRSHGDEDIKLTVKNAMETLSDDSQLAVSLYYMSSLSIKEIAHFMGISPGNVRVKLHRARKQLGERLEKMIGKHLSKEKLKAGFVFRLVDAIRDMPIPSLPKPRPIRWAPIPISIGIALLVGIIGYGISSGKDVSPDIPILKPAEATFAVSLFPNTDGQIALDAVSDKEFLDMGSQDIDQSDLASASAGTTTQTTPAMGTASSGIVVRQLWEVAEDIGAVSPDGRYISYVNWNNGNLGIHDLETGENREVTDEGNWGKDEQFVDASQHTKWSPDSKQIAYLWDKGEEISLRIVGIDGSEARVLCNNQAGSGTLPWAWSPDGKYILASQWAKTEETEEEEIEDIVLVSVADGSIRFVKSLGPGHSLIPSPRKGRKLPGFRDRASWMPTVRLSPDSGYVAYDSLQSEDSLERDIFLFAADGGHEMTLVEHPADDFDPFWSPDGDRIVFVSDRSGSFGIWVLEVVDGKPKGSPRLINDNLNGIRPLGLTQDGSYYYKLSGRPNDIYFADLDPETGKVLRPPTKAVQTLEGLNSRPDFSSDGKRLVYLSRRPEKRLVVRSLETGEERELQPDLPLVLLDPSLVLRDPSAPRWSPDGRSILVLAKSGPANETSVSLHQINVETGAVTPPVVWSDGHGEAITLPVWSPDGNKIFFMRQWGYSAAIRGYDLEAKREWSLDVHSKNGEALKTIHALALSPDGLQLALVECLKKDGHSLQIAPAAGGKAREILRLPFEESLPNACLAWTPDGRYLLFNKRKDESTELWRIPVEGGEPQNLGLTMKKIEHLSIHPDGRRIAFTGPGLSPSANVWVMENFLPKSTAGR